MTIAYAWHTDVRRTQITSKCLDGKIHVVINLREKVSLRYAYYNVACSKRVICRVFRTRVKKLYTRTATMYIHCCATAIRVK